MWPARSPAQIVAAAARLDARLHRPAPMAEGRGVVAAPFACARRPRRAGPRRRAGGRSSSPGARSRGCKATQTFALPFPASRAAAHQGARRRRAMRLVRADRAGARRRAGERARRAPAAAGLSSPTSPARRCCPRPARRCWRSAAPIACRISRSAAARRAARPAACACWPAARRWSRRARRSCGC